MSGFVVAWLQPCPRPLPQGHSISSNSAPLIPTTPDKLSRLASHTYLFIKPAPMLASPACGSPHFRSVGPNFRFGAPVLLSARPFHQLAIRRINPTNYCLLHMRASTA